MNLAMIFAFCSHHLEKSRFSSQNVRANRCLPTCNRPMNLVKIQVTLTRMLQSHHDVRFIKATL